MASCWSAISAAAILAGLVGCPRGPLSALLLFPPLRQLGRISYGVYLWHWPVILFLTHERTGVGGGQLLALRAAATVTIAALSWTLLEQPFHRMTVALHRRRADRSWLPRLAGATAGGLAGIAIVVGLVMAPLPAGRTANATTALDELHGDLGTSASSLTKNPVPSPTPRASEPATAAAPVHALVMGDSLAFTLAGGLYHVAAANDMTVDSAAIIGCGIAPDNPLHIDGQVAESPPLCNQWEQKWAQGISLVKPDVAIVMLGRWETVDRFWNGKWHAIGDPDFDAHLSAQLDTAIGIASKRGAKVALLDMPCFHAHELADGSTPPEDTAGRINEWNGLLARAALRHPGVVKVFSLDSVLCPGGTFAMNDPQGRPMRTDDGVHFTDQGGRDVGKMLLPEIVSWVRGTPSGRPPVD